MMARVEEPHSPEFVRGCPPGRQPPADHAKKHRGNSTGATASIRQNHAPEAALEEGQGASRTFDLGGEIPADREEESDRNAHRPPREEVEDPVRRGVANTPEQPGNIKLGIGQGRVKRDDQKDRRASQGIKFGYRRRGFDADRGRDLESPRRAKSLLRTSPRSGNPATRPLGKSARTLSTHRPETEKAETKGEARGKTTRDPWARGSPHRFFRRKKRTDTEFSACRSTDRKTSQPRRLLFRKDGENSRFSSSPRSRVGMPSSTLLRRHLTPAMSNGRGRTSVRDSIAAVDRGNEPAS